MKYDYEEKRAYIIQASTHFRRAFGDRFLSHFSLAILAALAADQ